LHSFVSEQKRTLITIETIVVFPNRNDLRSVSCRTDFAF